MAGVSTTNSSNTADANGVTTVFNFTFFVYSTADIKVYSVLDDVLTPITTGITKAINSSFIGGTVTFSVAPADVVGDILMRREVPYTQETEFAELTRYKETAIESALNAIVLQTQQLAEDISFCLKYNETSGVTDTTLEAPTDDCVLVFDGITGRVRVGSTTANIDTLAAISTDITAVAAVAAYIPTVAGIAANVTTVAGIASNVTTVAGVAAAVTTVAGISANVTTVAGIATAVSTVATNATAVSTVATNITNVNTVATNIANVNTVAGIAADGDITAVAGLSGTGLATRTAANTWTTRSLAAPAAGFSITNPAGVAGDPTFVLANDLAALEGLGSTGIAARTAADTWAQRTLTAPAAGFSITNPAGVAGNPTFVLADDLAALEALGSTGIAVRTAANTWAQRTITGTVRQITIADGDGVSANPTISLPVAVQFGDSHTLNSGADNGAILGGSNNAMNGSADNSAILGGTDHVVDVSRSAVIAGEFNQITGGDHNIIAGGNGHLISLGSRNVIAGGEANTISGNASDCAMIGGSANTISGNAGYATLIGGSVNVISAASSEATIVGGSVNTISAVGESNAMIGAVNCSAITPAAYSLTTGLYAKATMHGQHVRASGRIAAQGDAQVSDVIWFGSTANNTQTEIFLDGSALRAIIPSDTTWRFRIDVVARRSDADNESAGYTIDGVIDNNAGTVALVSTVTATYTNEDTAAWAVTAEADNTAKALVIKVTGENAKTIKWLADGHLLMLTA